MGKTNCKDAGISDDACKASGGNKAACYSSVDKRTGFLVGHCYCDAGDYSCGFHEDGNCAKCDGDNCNKCNVPAANECGDVGYYGTECKRDHGTGACASACEKNGGQYDYCGIPGHGGAPVCTCDKCSHPPCAPTHCGGIF